MRAVDHLPMGGKKFKSSVFKQKLNSSVNNNGLMQDVSDHKEAINKAVAKYASLIKKGKFNSTYQNSALREIKAVTPLSSKQTVIVKSVLKHLSKVDNEVIKVSHARINRAGDLDIKSTGMANQSSLVNRSGLSAVATPTNVNRYLPRSMVSISQTQKGNSSGLNTDKSINNSPSIPLVR